MFFSLPSSLLSLVLCILECRGIALASGAPNAPLISRGNIAGYVATGLGGSTNPTTTSPWGATITPPATTGSGPAFASSCQTALLSWSQASFSWQWAHAINETSTYSSAVVYTSEAPGTTRITSVITLCDGYPRVVGHTSTSRGSEYVKTDAYTNTWTAQEPNHAYPTPAPCSIQPSDCRRLSSSFDQYVSEKGEVTDSPPPCTIPYSTQSYSVGSTGQTCNNCMIVASTARLMYWPITTAPGTGDLCSGVSTIAGTPTGSGPNTFVTEGITITSPTVAISFGYMSRADNCGKTIDHTVIPVRPEQVTSVRGFRALFEHHQFNFADLNYHCINANSTNFTSSDNGGDNCYQAVPAEAYFGGLNNAAVYDQYVFRTMSKWQSTIYNNYQPQILPPQTMTSAIESIWGDHCIIHPDGVWDPPIALAPEPTLDLPSFGPGESARGPSTTISASPGLPYAPESPAQETGGPEIAEPSSTHELHFTALPENGASTTGGSQDGDGARPTTAVSKMPNGPSNGPEQPASSADSDTNANNGGSTAGANAPTPASAMGGVASESGDRAQVIIGSATCSVISSASNFQVLGDGERTITVSRGGAATSIGGQVVSIAPSGGLVVGTGAQVATLTDATPPNADTTVAITNTKTIVASQLSDGAWVMPVSSTTRAISPGGSPVTIDAVTLSAASTGASARTSMGSQTIPTEGNQATGTGSSAEATQDSGAAGRNMESGFVWMLGSAFFGIFARWDILLL